METNNFNAVYGSLLAIFPGVRCGTGDCRPLQAAGQLPSSGGLPLDQGVSLNCGIRVQCFVRRCRIPLKLRKAIGQPGFQLGTKDLTPLVPELLVDDALFL